MDEYIDSFLSSSSWSETTLPERSSWSSTPTSQTNGFPLECSNGSSDKKSNSYVVSMDQILGNTPNPVVGMNSSVCAVQKLNDSPAMLHEQNQPCHKLPEKFQPDFENGVLSRRLALQGHASLGSNGRESSMFAQSLSDAQTIATATPKWLPVYSNMPTLTVDSAALQDLSVRGCYVDTEADILTKEHTHDDLLHVQTTLNEPGELQTSNAPSYMSGSNIDLACDGMYMNYESYNGNTIKYYANDDSVPIMHPASNLNGPSLSAKPRARARRGQATDPHSIAERLRREKISERMKNLQELVPNSNRTDKASMLDEIIDYVKFLQLQVKVLSTSRRGAASSVPPLLTDFQQEDAKELVLSSSMEAMHDLSSSQDDTEFEQEVLKLLESNVTSAMQFLRSKGLCLMPVSLATTISSRRCSSVAIPPGKKKHISTSSIAPQKGDGTRKEKRDRLEKSNGCNGAAIRRQEANKGTSSY